jgi:threonine/homoserine/homoserine lactone efflux protein
MHNGLSFLSVGLFALTYFFFVASPGPAVAAVIARALTGGAARTFPFIMGIALGDALWFTLAVFGLAAVVTRFAGLIDVIKYAGALYLVYLAIKIWRSPVDARKSPLELKGEGFKLFLGGLSLCIGNPKPMVFFLAILPSVMSLEAVSWPLYLTLCGIIMLILGGSMVVYALLADRLRFFLNTPTKLKNVNICTALLMCGAALAIALS